jgi:hypothetical protein
MAQGLSLLLAHLLPESGQFRFADQMRARDLLAGPDLAEGELCAPVLTGHGLTTPCHDAQISRGHYAGLDVGATVEVMLSWEIGTMLVEE